MRPAVSINFCLPVKNGWQEEQISTRISPLWVERVLKLVQAQMSADFVVSGVNTGLHVITGVLSNLVYQKYKPRDP